jgi:hypothetical protein
MTNGKMPAPSYRPRLYIYGGRSTPIAMSVYMFMRAGYGWIALTAFYKNGAHAQRTTWRGSKAKLKPARPITPNPSRCIWNTNVPMARRKTGERPPSADPESTRPRLAIRHSLPRPRPVGHGCGSECQCRRLDNYPVILLNLRMHRIRCK